MKDTKMYIVSFSDSRQFRYYNPEGLEGLTHIENELNEYLKSLYPDETFAYYTSPKVTEVAPDQADEYTSYPVLDNAAVEKIKIELKNEIAVRMSDKSLNSDAPFNTVAPEY